MRQTDHLSIGEGKIIEAQKGSVNVVSGMGMLVLVCFFSSGISGLIYQILWTRMIVKVIGGRALCRQRHFNYLYGGLRPGSLAGQPVYRSVPRSGRAVENVRSPGTGHWNLRGRDTDSAKGFFTAVQRPV